MSDHSSVSEDLEIPEDYNTKVVTTNCPEIQISEPVLSEMKQNEIILSDK